MSDFTRSRSTGQNNYGRTNEALPPAVAAIGKIHFEGNIIPHEWYNHIKLPSGKPDVVGIIILSEIVYWYRPVTQIDEHTGRKVIKRAKFSGDKFRSPIMYYTDKFGFTKDQVRQALKRLEEGGYITREYRDYIWKDTGKPLMTNMTYAEPVAERIMEITHPEPEPEPGPSEPGPSPEELGQENCPQNLESYQEPGVEPVSMGEISIPQGEVSVPQGEVSVPLYIKKEISTKTSTKTTTTTEAPPSSQDPPVNESGGSGNLIYPKELFPEEGKEAARMLEAVSEQAQQLLDELAGQLRAKEIKNPLGYLRRLITKAKEGKFSAAAGIKVGESRKRARRAAMEGCIFEERGRAKTEVGLKASEERVSKPLEGPRKEERGRQLDELRKLRQSLWATAHL